MLVCPSPDRREKLVGIASLLRYAARIGKGQDLYGSSPLDATCASALTSTRRSRPGSSSPSAAVSLSSMSFLSSAVACAHPAPW